MSVDIYLLLLLTVLVVFIIPILIQISRMLGSVNDLLKTANESVKLMVAELTRTLESANKIIATVNSIIENAKELGIAFKGLSEGASKLGTTLKDSGSYITGLLQQMTGFVSSLKTTLSVLAKGLLKKGG
ncbi:MAG: DUF948 domain-containing protein [Candidatus Magnetobacterium sp. LHC-1]|uniref:DUF948 domain-containing protein n=1 Tax=Candidatus Magnetobacterium casense TaxID=1455061 RepID=A0ABS6RZE1_9BACT|nr:DUF948 domain-containing protein [Candidatus Magnetobacterium casensis]MBF0607186.1 DUF948 domain-containing protein [Nitrospirota bacterium]MBV6342014.1 DUF948 domain-containing protein [Candidatus Magnetobacterium casensis]